MFACCLLLLHRLLYNSVHLLHAATRLKQNGVLPQDLQLWAVANPVTEPSAALAAAKVGGCQVHQCLADTTAAWSLFGVLPCTARALVQLCPAVSNDLHKLHIQVPLAPTHDAQSLLPWHQVAAGAQVLLTQPPLDWPAFQRWMTDAVDRGLHEQAHLVIGYPCLSGAANVTFWGALCGATNNSQVSSRAGAKAWCTGHSWGLLLICKKTLDQSHPPALMSG
jgi:hypothetical protein